MAATFGQIKLASGGFGVQSLAITFDSDVDGSDAVIIAAVDGNGDVVLDSVTDNKSNTYTSRIIHAAQDVLTAPVTTGGSSFEVTFTKSANNGLRRVQILEIRGADDFDVAASINSASSTDPQSNSLTPSADGALIVGVVSSSVGGPTTADAPFTLRGNQDAVEGGDFNTETFEQVTAATDNADFTLTSSVFWKCNALAISAAAVGGPTHPGWISSRGGWF